MEIKVDDVSVFTLTDTQKSVLQDEISSVIFEDDMKRRLEWILKHKYEQCYKKLRAHWEPIFIAEEVESLPTDPDAFAALVFAHDDYKDRATRDAEQ